MAAVYVLCTNSEDAQDNVERSAAMEWIMRATIEISIGRNHNWKIREMQAIRNHDPKTKPPKFTAPDMHNHSCPLNDDA